MNTPHVSAIAKTSKLGIIYMPLLCSTNKFMHPSEIVPSLGALEVSLYAY
jgi:hypothetical protein